MYSVKVSLLWPEAAGPQSGADPLIMFCIIMYLVPFLLPRPIFVTILRDIYAEVRNMDFGTES